MKEHPKGSVRAVIACAASVALLAACGTSPVTTNVQQLVAAAAPDAPVSCEGDCKIPWQRAQLWLAKHSAWKIQTSTDVLLQTFSPVDYEPSYGFAVTREPRSSGGYSIAVNLVCGNPMGCDPQPADIRRAFYEYVSTGRDVLEGAGYLSGIR